MSKKQKVDAPCPEYERIQENWRSASKTYREKHRDEILARARAKKNANAAAAVEVAREPEKVSEATRSAAAAAGTRVMVAAAAAADHDAAPMYKANVAVNYKGKKFTNTTLSVKFTTQSIRDAIDKLHAEGKVESGSLRKYKSDVNVLGEIIKKIGKKDFVSAFNDTSALIAAIKNQKKSSGEPYKENSMKSRFQAIVWIIDHIPFIGQFVNKKTKDVYVREWDIKKIISNEEAEEKKKEEVIDWEDYLRIVREAYGEDSKEFLVASLYSLVPARDDFQLIIISFLDEADDKKKNYICSPAIGECTVIINTYKTQKKYGWNNLYELTPETSNLVRNYIAEHNLSDGDYLFRDKSLSKFVSDFNQRLNLRHKITINVFRKMWVARGLPENATPEQMVDLARKLLHSVAAQQTSYKRRLAVGGGGKTKK